jgi:hypothetical protein
MLWYMLLHEELRVWEQRVGSWVARCQTCHRDVWQLTYRIWRTKGSGLNPASPWSMPVYGEAYQVRCSGCGAAGMVGHPNQWVPPLGQAFVWEQYPPTQAMANYLQIAFPFFR